MTRAFITIQLLRARRSLAHHGQRYLSGIFLMVSCIFLTPNPAGAQTQKSTPAPADTARDEFIRIRFSNEFSFRIAGRDTLKKLSGKVALKQDDILLFCDSALILNSTFVRARGNFILQQGDSVTIFADSAEYRSDTKIARLFSEVSLVNGDQKLFTDILTYDANTKIASYLTGAVLMDDSTFVRSRKGFFHTQTRDVFFKDSVVIVHPEFILRSDTLQFNTSSKVVTFNAPTLIIRDSARIYTEGGFYDVDDKLAEFTKNPQYIRNDRRAKSRLMRYNGRQKEIILIGEAISEDSTTFASAELISYNENTEVTVLEGNSFIRDRERTIQGEKITYDARNRTYSTRGRTTVIDGPQILEADQVDYNKEKKLALVQGKVIWQDTTERLTVQCAFAEHSKEKNFLKATGGQGGRPLLVKIIDEDTMYLSADTLMSFEPQRPPDNLLPPEITSDTSSATHPTNTSKTDTSHQQNTAAHHHPTETQTHTPLSEIRDTLTTGITTPPPTLRPRTILAWYDVRIFKKDLQAMCDSLSYSNTDSLFRLYQQPIIWSDSSQFTADTVLIQLKHNKVDRIFLRLNSFILNTPDEIFFNQIKGKNSIAFFENSKIQRVRVSGNAESVYYARDEKKAYIGVNQAVCSEMLVIFDGNEVSGIRFYTEPKATLFPMKKADHEALKMNGFNWQYAQRPTSVEDILRSGITRKTDVPEKAEQGK